MLLHHHQLLFSLTGNPPESKTEPAISDESRSRDAGSTDENVKNISGWLYKVIVNPFLLMYVLDYDTATLISYRSRKLKSTDDTTNDTMKIGKINNKYKVLKAEATDKINNKIYNHAFKVDVTTMQGKGKTYLANCK